MEKSCANLRLALLWSCIGIYFLVLCASVSTVRAADYTMYYDGSYKYVTAPLATTTTADVTLEAWVNWWGSTSKYEYILLNGTTNSPYGGYALVITPSNVVAVSEEGNTERTSSLTIPTLTWTHVAAVRSGTSWSIFVNGVKETIPLASTPLTPTGAVYIGSGDAVNTGFNGNIDEVRISTYARYTANFTPQQYTFSNDAQTAALYHFNEGAGQFVHDASSNGHNGQVGSTGAADANDPSWATGTSPVLVVSTNRPVLQFDASDDIVKAPLVTTTTGDLTMEAWVNWAGSNGHYQYIILNGSVLSNSGYSLTINPTGYLELEEEGNTAHISSFTLTPNAWTHVAAVRSSTSWLFFKDGVGETSSGSSTPFTPTGSTYIGGSDLSGVGFNGKIAEARISSFARYSASFTPGNSHFAPDQYTLALYDMNEGSGQTVTDRSGNNKNGVLGSTSLSESSDPAWVTSDPPITQTQGNAVTFSGFQQYLKAPIPTYQGDNVTFEAWVKWNGPNGVAAPRAGRGDGNGGDLPLSATASSQCIMTNGNTGANGIALYLIYLGGTTYRLGGLLGGMALLATSSDSLLLNTWTHVALVRRSGAWYFYTNGVGTSLSSSATPFAATGNLFIGATQSAGDAFKGAIDEVRISTIARYNANFTPSSWPFTTDQNTVALYHFDASSGQSAADNSGNANNAQFGSTSGTDGNDPSWGSSDAPLPITLSEFTGKLVSASGAGIDVKLDWTTVSEENNYGFYVERTVELSGHKAGEWKAVSDLIPGAGTTLESRQYSFTDPGVAAGSYFYRLKFVGTTGEVSYSHEVFIVVTGTLSAGEDNLPRSFALHQNYPNPFNPTTTIRFDLPKGSHVTLAVYNLLGQKVANLIDGNMDAGFQTVTWNALDGSGAAVPSGVYLCRITAGSFAAVAKMALIR